MKKEAKMHQIPSWMETPSNSQINPPVQTRKQELPFGELAWEDFEKLCLRLARQKAYIEYCDLYGERGQKQEGIDLYAKIESSEKYWVYQCKREKNFTPTKIKKAVTKFLDGEWAKKSECFFLCTTDSLGATQKSKKIEEQREILKAQGIRLESWDNRRLSEILKDKPEIVDDFFGRNWVKVFCGEDEARKLEKRLDANEVRSFREVCLRFYKNVFNKLDPGLPIPSSDGTNILDLEKRFVFPDIFSQKSIGVTTFDKGDANDPSDDSAVEFDSGNITGNRRERKIRKPSGSTREYTHKQKFEIWLNSNNKSVILGDPGSGKSTLSRFIAIDLLQDSPKMELLGKKWGQFLPIWIPFARWTKLISEHSSSEVSLKEFMAIWLKGFDNDTIWPLVEKALDDKRLLLIVDGLDEWTNQAAAQVALQKLQVFIDDKEIPVIITSRPHGFRKLSFYHVGWNIGELSELSATQQKELCQIWVKHKESVVSEGGKHSKGEIERLVDRETDEFMFELEKSSDLGELAKVPLLLYLLIAMKFSNVRLPRSRFKAYGALVELLITEHPARRRTSAQITDAISDLQPEEMEGVLAWFAYQVMENHSDGLINEQQALAIIESYLRDTEIGLGFDTPSARKQARQILSTVEDEFGLLVRKSSEEIGFFHRSLLEFLSSKHIVRMDIDDQVNLIKKCCADPQWREIILGLFYLTNRASELNRFVECIKEKEVNTVERYHIETLLAEVAFGDFKCSVELARVLANEVFYKIEKGVWMPQRERLLHYVFDGLRSSATKELVKSKLRRWFPDSLGWSRKGVIRIMAKWPKTPEVIECLLQGLLDEELDCKKSSAVALSELAKGDKETEKKIKLLATNSIDIETRAVSLDALLRGWPEIDGLDDILRSARKSLCQELRLVAIKGRVKRKYQNEKDLEELFRLANWERGLGYEWREEIIQLFLSGWPKSSKVKDSCIKTLKLPITERKKEILDKEIAFTVLIKGYPQDDEVAKFISEDLLQDKIRYLGSKTANWELLSKNFKDHPDLADAIDEWISKQRSRDSEISRIALLSRTKTAKNKLLDNVVSSSFPHWSAQALIEGWGMGDPEVSRVLNQIAYGTEERASRIGYLLPQIIVDSGECSKRLLEILKAPDCSRHDFVTHALSMLLKKEGVKQEKKEIVDFILDLEEEATFGDGWVRECVIGFLIELFPEYSRVRKLAKKELMIRSGAYSSVALAYKDDPEIRSLIIDRVSPLPIHLRFAIASRMGENLGDLDFNLSLLENYDLEADVETMTQASIGYHTLLKTHDIDTNRAIEKLSGSIVCYGSDYEDRRQAAFCGLAILGRLDIMVNAKETIGNDEMCAIELPYTVLKSNTPLIKFILSNWKDLKEVFGEELYARLSKNSNFHWDSFCALADDYTMVVDEILEFIESEKAKKITPAMLYLLERIRPKSSLLLNQCLKVLHDVDTDNFDYREKNIAVSEILGRNFGGNEEVLHKIINQPPNYFKQEKIVLALGEGWPQNKLLDEYFEDVTKNNRKLPYYNLFQIICQKGDTEFTYNSIGRFFNETQKYHLMNLSNAMKKFVIKRLQSDDDLYEMLVDDLDKQISISQKVSTLKLLSLSKGLSDEIRDLCMNDLDRQLDTKFPQVAIDVVYGEIRPVAYSMLDMVY